MSFDKKSLINQKNTDQLHVVSFNKSHRLITTKSLTRSCERIVDFLFDNNGAQTPDIVDMCDVRNVSDAIIKNRERLKSIGLRIECVMTERRNLFGDLVPVGSWFLEIEDPSVFFGVSAAND